jgi:hypothetical protein
MYKQKQKQKWRPDQAAYAANTLQRYYLRRTQKARLGESHNTGKFEKTE